MREDRAVTARPPTLWVDPRPFAVDWTIFESTQIVGITPVLLADTDPTRIAIGANFYPLAAASFGILTTQSAPSIPPGIVTGPPSVWFDYRSHGGLVAVKWYARASANTVLVQVFHVYYRPRGG